MQLSRSFKALACFGFALVAVAPASASYAERATTDPASQSLQFKAYEYRLGPGDKVQVSTFNEPSLSGSFDVSGTGTVSIPLVGDLKAEGLTTAEFGRSVEAALREGFLTHPQVSVSVLNYRPFYILGEITKPGEYPYTNGLTVMNAVATANGFTYRADTHHVFIKRANETVEHEVDLNATTTVEPGDTIRIRERFF